MVCPFLFPQCQHTVCNDTLERLVQCGLLFCSCSCVWVVLWHIHNSSDILALSWKELTKIKVPQVPLNSFSGIFRVHVSIVNSLRRPITSGFIDIWKRDLNIQLLVMTKVLYIGHAWRLSYLHGNQMVETSETACEMIFIHWLSWGQTPVYQDQDWTWTFTK